MKILLTTITFCILLSIALVPDVFGHGVGGETLLPVDIGDRMATISINVEPPIYDPTNDEQRILIKFFNAETQQVIENVYYKIKISNGVDFIEDTFFDELGFLILNFQKTNSNIISIDGIKESTTNAWMHDSNKPLVIKSSLFDQGGLYYVDVEILGYDSSDNLLDEPIVFNAAVSIASKTLHNIPDSNQNSYEFGITSYYDAINNFEYDSKEQEISFSMPFTWTESYIEQIEIIHEEFHVPKSFAELLVTKYDVEINGIPLGHGSLVIDDYSENDRLVHAILHQPFLQSIKDRASQVSDSEILFKFKPSAETQLPLTGHTTSVEYNVDLWWEPVTIKTEQPTKFFVDVNEVYPVIKNPDSIFYDFILEQDGQEIFRKSVNAKMNSPPKSFDIDYEFSKDQIGSTNLIVEKINGKTYASIDFVVVVESQDNSNPTFPIRLSSQFINENKQPQEGNYFVDITWFSNPLEINEESEFIITIYDKVTGYPVSQAEYDLVILSEDGLELLRTSGLAKAGGSFENFKFEESHLGNVVLRIENIDQSNEFAEITTAITPEFGTITIFVLIIAIISTIVISTNSKLSLIKYF